MGRTAVTIGFSVPPETARLVDRMAANEGRSRSELFRDMVRVYREQRELEVFEDIAAHGHEQAENRGIRTEADVERVISESRSDR
ncbi:MAG: ribbon-helix-helix domain-containing protein [Coriobacteriia bacterium]|nr:ribbon-helix-helix domain-containing protein [Coriobacteriia bacterium]